MPIDSKECFAALTEDGQLWEIYQAAQSGGGGGGITSINGDTTAAQTIAGTAPIGVASVGGTTTISSTQAGTATNGYLSSTDWNTFNNKVNRSGDTMTGKLTAAADDTSAKFNIGNAITGTNPATTVNGDLWITNGNRLAYRSNSTIYSTAQTNLANTFNNNQAIDTSTTIAALRVTQRGTGEAFRVEDDTTPDATAFVVSNSGRVGIGVTPDATVALSVDTTGIKFGDNTVQTTAAVSGVTSVTATAPLTSSGGATPDISTSIATNRIVGRSTAGTGVMEQLTPVGITVSGGNITGIGGTVGTVDNAVPRADGTGGFTVQGSGLIVEDAIESFTSITGDAGTDVITATGSAFANGQPVRFTALTGGSGLNTTTNYFVREVSGATFKLETSIGGGAINFTTNITAGTLLTGHSVSTNVTLSENTTATNSDLVLTPKGTGAFILGPKPNGAASGGNARGTNAIDFQLDRTSATQVASGLRSFIANGSINTSSGNYCFSGGYQATASGNTSFCYAIESSATTNEANVVLGGRTNTATGTYSAILAGNINQTPSGANNSAIAGGSTNTISSTYSFIGGGLNTNANRYAMQAHAAGQFAAQGDAQRARFVMRCKTTTNAAVEMTLDGAAPGASNRLTIPAGKYLTGTINIAGIKSDGATAASYIRQFSIKHISATATTSLVGTVNTVGVDEAAGTTISITANDTNDALKVDVTGITSETWRWVAAVDVVEVGYGT